MIDNLILKFKDISNIKWDFEKNNLNSLSNADILISDFRGDSCYGVII
jgi:hypothetical protein